jgi:hypothetical protein
VLKSCLLAVVCAGLSACHTMHFEITDEPHAEEVYDRKHYFLGGLVPTVEVDVRDHCPHGIAAVREEQTFVDGLLELPTLGIWSPRSSWYYCLPAPPPQGDTQ